MPPIGGPFVPVTMTPARRSACVAKTARDSGRASDVGSGAMPLAFSAFRCQIDGLVSDLVHEIFFRLCAPFDTRSRPGGPTHCALIQSTGAHLDQDDLVTVTDESVQRACCADPTPAGALGAIAGNPSSAMADAPLAMVVNTNLFTCHRWPPIVRTR
jgi:hypothetical protein